MSHDEESCNSSGNRTFAEVVQTASSRRSFLTGTVGLAAATFIAPSLGQTLTLTQSNGLGSRNV